MREIVNLQAAMNLARFTSKMDSEGGAEEIFDLLRAPAEQPGRGHVFPISAMLGALRWAWLSAHAGVPADAIRNGLARVVQRGVEVNERATHNNFRYSYDPILLSAAILTRDNSLARAAASTAITADSSLNRGQAYFAAWSGLLKFAIQQNEEAMQEQGQWIAASARMRYYSSLGKALVCRFIEGDHRAIVKQIEKDVQIYEVIARRSRALKLSPAGEIFDAQQQSVNHFWPWPEAAIAVLATCDLADRSERVAFWLPASLITD